MIFFLFFFSFSFLFFFIFPCFSFFHIFVSASLRSGNEVDRLDCFSLVEDNCKSHSNDFSLFFNVLQFRFFSFSRRLETEDAAGFFHSLCRVAAQSQVKVSSPEIENQEKTEKIERTEKKENEKMSRKVESLAGEWFQLTDRGILWKEVTATVSKAKKLKTEITVKKQFNHFF